jgi:hypothetical protein
MVDLQSVDDVGVIDMTDDEEDRAGAAGGTVGGDCADRVEVDRARTDV